MRPRLVDGGFSAFDGSNLSCPHSGASKFVTSLHRSEPDGLMSYKFYRFFKLQGSDKYMQVVFQLLIVYQFGD